MQHVTVTWRSVNLSSLIQLSHCEVRSQTHSNSKRKKREHQLWILLALKQDSPTEFILLQRRAAIWWDLYMCEPVCLSPSPCRNLQTHLTRHKQRWPGKIVEIPPPYQGIWGFGLTIHTNGETTGERGVGNGGDTGSGSKCVGLTDIDTNEW